MFEISLLVLLSVSILIYFRIADKLSIIDKPNSRSSHVTPTVRGGGIIFIIALLMWFVASGFLYPWFIAGALLIALISFADDIRELPPVYRFGVQLIALLLLAKQLDFFHGQLGWVIAVLIVGVGTVNAFNFMDGINGITGIYGLINLGSFLLVNEKMFRFTNQHLIVSLLIAVTVFLFFNFRRRARCFAGDVGSVTLAFAQVFLSLQLMLATMSMGWLLFFLVFGADAVVTILYRLRRRENITKPHRTHVYQFLANEWKVDHRVVSLIYGLLQLIINLIVIFFFPDLSLFQVVMVILLAGGITILVRQVVLSRIGR